MTSTDMKSYVLLALFFLAATGLAQAQSFDEGLELYESEQYAEALAVFQQIDDERSVLFAGKSHLAIGNNHDAIAAFKALDEAENQSIRNEAVFSLALAQFRLKSFDRSLSNLYELIQNDNRTRLRLDAQRLYRQIINYLSVNERFEVMERVERPSIRYDVVTNSRTFVDQGTYRSLVSHLARMEPDTTVRRELTESLLDEESDLHQFFNRYPNAPQGTVYQLGVVLPAFEEDDPDFTIPRNLYYGMMFAADEFNSRNTDQKVKLTFKSSAEDPDSAAAALTELAWSHKADAVIGPLFSEPATRMAELAEEYRIPMLAPLANSDELNLDYNYTFQLNPTFEVHGRQMARFAVEELGLDTLAVITEHGTIGRSAANSFRREAERLGAHISYFFDEDFSQRGYDLTEFTEVFTPDTAMIDSLGYTPTQGIYAPFTGQAASTLTNLLLTDLEAMRSDMIIMGSEEWANVTPSAFQRRIFEIYYSEGFGPADNRNDEEFEFFGEDFETRFGTEPDRFARIGYDAAAFILQSLETAGNPVYLGRAIRNAAPYEGAALRVNFDGRRINQHIHILPLTPMAEERLYPEQDDTGEED